MSRIISTAALIGGAIDGYYNAQGIPLSNSMDNLLFHAAPLANGAMYGVPAAIGGGAVAAGGAIDRFSSGLENVVRGSVGGVAGAAITGTVVGGMVASVTYVYTLIGYAGGYIAGKML